MLSHNLQRVLTTIDVKVYESTNYAWEVSQKETLIVLKEHQGKTKICSRTPRETLGLLEHVFWTERQI